MTDITPTNAPPNWPAIWMFALSGAAAITVVPWYGLTHGYTASAWLAFVIVLSLAELSITCGYHRLFAHVSYEANWPLRLVYLLLGAMTLQNTALLWSTGHRAHHRYMDDLDRDPYCARKGFWFSHMGWMLRNYPSGNPDFRTVRDLKNDPLVMWQHRFYVPIALAMNLAVPLLAGFIIHDFLSAFLLVGVLRLVVCHQLTFCINSLAHMAGSRPYDMDGTARDNPWVALLTFGEGYHNYHHKFGRDYRNAVGWWQWDPSKWLIFALSKVGLVRNLHRVSAFRIRRARLDAQFKQAEVALASPSADDARHQHLRKRVEEEYAAFKAALGAWTGLREQWSEARQAALEGWERAVLLSRSNELERLLRGQHRRMRRLLDQLCVSQAVGQTG